MYYNTCCSCSFEPEILNIGQSSHKMYINNIVNFQESTTILNAHTKKVWKLIVCTLNFFFFSIFLTGGPRTAGPEKVVCRRAKPSPKQQQQPGPDAGPAPGEGHPAKSSAQPTGRGGGGSRRGRRGRGHHADGPPPSYSSR